MQYYSSYSSPADSDAYPHNSLADKWFGKTVVRISGVIGTTGVQTASAEADTLPTELLHPVYPHSVKSVHLVMNYVFTIYRDSKKEKECHFTASWFRKYETSGYESKELTCKRVVNSQRMSANVNHKF